MWYCAVVEFVAPCQREQSGPLGGTFTREVTVFAGYARWRLSVYKYCWVSQPLLLPRSAIVLAFASLPSPRAQTLEHIVAEPLHSSHKMSVRLIAADDWRPSSKTEHRLLELENEGLQRPRVSSSQPEWIAPAVDHREPRPPKGYVVSFTKFHRHGLGSPPIRFMRALCHHYGVELQHFSPNAITAVAIFAAVCEGYLGMMPHWDLCLHLYQGELFHAPGGATGVRKPVRAGCLNLVLKTDKVEEPREYIPVGLTSNHAGWDSQWFYLRNDDDRFPAYIGCLISERPDHWKYGVIQTHLSRLRPILDALKKLCEEGLTATLILLAVHR